MALAGCSWGGGATPNAGGSTMAVPETEAKWVASPGAALETERPQETADAAPGRPIEPVDAAGEA